MEYLYKFMPEETEYPSPPRQRVSQTLTSLTVRQLQQLWPTLTWPHQPLPVLHVGCRSGDIAAKFLAPRVPEGTKIVACDACPGWLEYARQYNSVPDVIDHRLFDVEAADVEPTAVWQSGPYCKVFALLMAQEAALNRQAIQNIHKLLEPGGEAIFSVIPKICFWQKYEELIDSPIWRQGVQDLQRCVSLYMPPEDPFFEMIQLLIEEGFHIVHAWTGPVEVQITEEEETRQLQVSLKKFMNIILDSLLEEFTDGEFCGTSQNQMRRGDVYSGERREAPYTSMVIVGRKQ